MDMHKMLGRGLVLWRTGTRSRRSLLVRSSGAAGIGGALANWNYANQQQQHRALSERKEGGDGAQDRGLGDNEKKDSFFANAFLEDCFNFLKHEVLVETNEEGKKEDGKHGDVTQNKPKQTVSFYESIQEKVNSELEKFEKVAGWSDLASSLKDILIQRDPENATRTLIEKARETTNAGEFQKNVSFLELKEIFDRESESLATVLDKNFGHLDFHQFDPSALFYYLEKEDETKNPSWKRRKHRFQFGVHAREMLKLRESLFLADLSYLDTHQEIQDGLSSVHGGRSWELVFSDTEGLPGQPANYLAIKKGVGSRSEPLTVLIVVRGTKTIGDFFTDASLDPVPYRGGFAHAGMIASGKYLGEKHQPILEKLQKFSGRKVKVEVVGHSLGASAAVTLGYELKDKGYDVSVVGFGCPALFSKELAQDCKSFVTTVINDSDFIPRCSGATISNLVVDILEFDWKDRALRDIREAISELEYRSPISFREKDLSKIIELASLGLEKYVSVKESTVERASQILFPPGTCLHLYRDGRGISCSFTPPEFFSEIDITRTMIDDHLIEGYDAAFAQIIKEHYGSVEEMKLRSKA